MQIREGLYYNPYFPGGAIAMPKMLADEGAEYDDGTVATESQQAKVSCCYFGATGLDMCSMLTLQTPMGYPPNLIIRLRQSLLYSGALQTRRKHKASYAQA